MASNRKATVERPLTRKCKILVALHDMRLGCWRHLSLSMILMQWLMPLMVGCWFTINISS
eukprot:scaffold137923_cov18-Prasinocladus_malaysianus.AAC.2